MIARAKVSGSLEKAENFASRLRALTDEGVDIETCEITELLFELSQKDISVRHPKKQFDLRDFDLVIVRHIGKRLVEAQMIAQYCEYFNIAYTDHYLNRLLPDSKLSNAFTLWCAGITQWPHSFAGPMEELVKSLPKLGDKAVLKDSDGSKGRLNFVVTSQDEIESVITANPDVQFVLQEYIPNDSDFRVLVMNGHVTMVIRRSGDGSSHLNNTSQGGVAELVAIEEVSQEIIDRSIVAAKILKLQVAGVDVMRDARTGKYYFLEVNNAPQVSSGSFMTEKSEAYAHMIRDLLAEGDA